MHIDKISLSCNTLLSTTRAAPQPSYLRVFYVHFIALWPLRPQGFLEGIRLLIIANHPVTVRSGRSLGVLMVGFFCPPSKPEEVPLWHLNKTASTPEANPTGANALRRLPAISLSVKIPSSEFQKEAQNDRRHIP